MSKRSYSLSGGTEFCNPNAKIELINFTSIKAEL